MMANTACCGGDAFEKPFVLCNVSGCQVPFVQSLQDRALIRIFSERPLGFLGLVRFLVPLRQHASASFGESTA